MKVLNTHSEVDQIVHYLQGKSNADLTPTLQVLLKRYEYCADLIKQWGSRHKVVPIMIRTFKISQAQAYRDFADCQEIFGSTPRSSRDFYLDILLGNITETRTKAIENKDFKTAATCDRNMLLVVQEYFQDQAIPWDKVQPQDIMLGWFPQLSNIKIPDNWETLVSDMVNKKKRNTNSLNATDIEEVNDNEQ